MFIQDILQIHICVYVLDFSIRSADAHTEVSMHVLHGRERMATHALCICIGDRLYTQNLECTVQTWTCSGPGRGSRARPARPPLTSAPWPRSCSLCTGIIVRIRVRVSGASVLCTAGPSHHFLLVQSPIMRSTASQGNVCSYVSFGPRCNACPPVQCMRCICRILIASKAWQGQPGQPEYGDENQDAT